VDESQLIAKLILHDKREPEFSPHIEGQSKKGEQLFITWIRLHLVYKLIFAVLTVQSSASLDVLQFVVRLFVLGWQMSQLRLLGHCINFRLEHWLFF